MFWFSVFSPILSDADAEVWAQKGRGHSYALYLRGRRRNVEPLTSI